jgi:HAD superfamily hydrolase (TIGR01458 family)
LEQIRGVLLDIDGTLLSGESAIAGAPELIRRLRGRGLPFRLSTNTTRMPRDDVVAWLRSAGVEVEPHEVFTPTILARKRILDAGRPRAALLVAAETKRDFEGIEPDETAPQWVVVGDLAEGFTWDVLNRAFRWLRNGAALLALQKNRYWRVDGELRIDAGPFVAALEYAAGVEAEVVGKPSGRFFRLVLDVLGLPPEKVLVVGDDIVTDVLGGASAGCKTALVRTGKFTPADLEAAGAIRPDLVLDSVAGLFPESGVKPA